MHLVKTRLLVELVFDIYIISMELRSFEKPYVTLLNSANWAYKGPIPEKLFLLDNYLCFFIRSINFESAGILSLVLALVNKN